MKIETEQLLGTLELLVRHSFFWETEQRGAFNSWNLMIAEGFVQLTDIEIVLEGWQAVERWGTVTDPKSKDYGYAPSREERDEVWNSEIEAERAAKYQALLKLLQSNVQNLQAFSLSIPKDAGDCFEWDHPAFSVGILIGKLTDDDWLCVSPTVPDQVTGRSRRRKQVSASSETTITLDVLSESLLSLRSSIRAISNDLGSVEVYGYYHGGYNYSYDHKIRFAIADTKENAIEQALQTAGMLAIEKTAVEYTGENRELSQFMNAVLSDRTIYTLSFWDIGYTYEVGQTSGFDWIGTRAKLEFEYNP
jgi:hypothetical protein